MTMGLSNTVAREREKQFGLQRPGYGLRRARPDYRGSIPSPQPQSRPDLERLLDPSTSKQDRLAIAVKMNGDQNGCRQLARLKQRIDVSGVTPRPGTDMRNAPYARLNLNGANLAGQNLGAIAGAQMNNAVLANATIGGDATNAQLNGAKAPGLMADGAILSGMQGANFAGDGGSFNRVRIEGGGLANASLAGAQMGSAALSNSNLADANLEGIRARRLTISGSNVEGLRMVGADLPELKFENNRGHGLAEDLKPGKGLEALVMQPTMISGNGRPPAFTSGRGHLRAMNAAGAVPAYVQDAPQPPVVARRRKPDYAMHPAPV